MLDKILYRLLNWCQLESKWSSGSAFVSGAKRLAVQILSRYDISSKGAVLPERNDVEMGPTNSLYALANTAIMIKDSILI